jgi:hypothetical protein
MATHTTLSADAQFQLDTLIWTAVQQVFEEPLNSSDEPISLLEQFLTRGNGHPQLPYQEPIPADPKKRSAAQLSKDLAEAREKREVVLGDDAVVINLVHEKLLQNDNILAYSSEVVVTGIVKQVDRYRSLNEENEWAIRQFYGGKS